MAKTTYVGLALSSTMFCGEALISRFQLSADEAAELIRGEDVVSCLNPSHVATIEALQERFEIEIPIPETAPKVCLEPGDTLLVLSAKFNRRLAEGERYTAEEVQAANFEFVVYRVLPLGASPVLWDATGAQELDPKTGNGLSRWLFL